MKMMFVIGNDGGGGKEMVRSSGGRSFKRRIGLLERNYENALTCGEVMPHC